MIFLSKLGDTGSPIATWKNMKLFIKIVGFCGCMALAAFFLSYVTRRDAVAKTIPSTNAPATIATNGIGVTIK